MGEGLRAKVVPEAALVRRAVRVALADLSPGDLVLLACSGGADSVALAVAVSREAARAGWRAGAVIVDHGLQEGSAGRSAALADQLTALGLAPVMVCTVEVSTDGGPEAAARTARYAALESCAARHHATAVLLGHTRDDQAESVLLGLARGSGARSLSGMAAVRGVHRRPLLGLSREVVRRAAAGHETWEDPHNADDRFARTRVRTTALPVLESTLGPGVAEALARSADLLRADADALDGWATSAYGECLDGTRTGCLALDVLRLAALPVSVRSRVLRRAALAAGSPASDLAAGHVGELDRLVTDWHGQGPLMLPGRVSAARACGTLALSGPQHGST